MWCWLLQLTLKREQLVGLGHFGLLNAQEISKGHTDVLTPV